MFTGVIPVLYAALINQHEPFEIAEAIVNEPRDFARVCNASLLRARTPISRGVWMRVRLRWLRVRHGARRGRLERSRIAAETIYATTNEHEVSIPNRPPATSRGNAL